MATPAYQRERRQLTDTLKELRVGAGLGGARLSQLIGWPQSKISKIETLKQLPCENDVTSWATAVGTPAEVAAELLERLRRARIEYTGVEGRLPVDRGSGHPG